MRPGATLFRTARLAVRRYRAADRPAHDALRADPDIARFVHWPEGEPDVFARIALEPGRHALDGNGWLTHAVTLGPRGAVIGDLGLRVAGAEATLGLALAPAHRRQGLGRELVEGAARFLAARGILRLVAEVDLPNEASRALFSTLGFIEQACLADANGAYVVLGRTGLGTGLGTDRATRLGTGVTPPRSEG